MNHFCTLFDSNFLAQGLCLHASLEQRDKNYHLWILCIDNKVFEQLTTLALPKVSLVQLHEIETKELLLTKKTRSIAEYCWTLTPILPKYILTKHNDIPQITYLDADLFFFKNPKVILNEFKKSGKHVLITEHDFSPAYNQVETTGKFCVQFITFRNTREAFIVLEWWAERCIEWCYARHENGKFGDQMYLDQWPVLFSDSIYILQEKKLALAPWNIQKYHQDTPCFYHFHGLRIVSKNFVRLYLGYKIPRKSKWIYKNYLEILRINLVIITKNKWKIPTLPEYPPIKQLLIILARSITNIGSYKKL